MVIYMVIIVVMVFTIHNMTSMNGWGAETSGNPSARYLVDPLFVDAPDGH
ncbi:MAG: hypothetical protein MZV64_69505 [Ignavibacteriales bacterium]|nr:hypothetical protein [Ignavibacteriales bacterium]